MPTGLKSVDLSALDCSVCNSGFSSAKSCFKLFSPLLGGVEEHIFLFMPHFATGNQHWINQHTWHNRHIVQ